MKTTLLLIALLFSVSSFAQTQSGVYAQPVLGKGKPQRSLQLSLDVYPFLFLSNGGGGTASVEFDHWQIGGVGFSVVPPDYITKTFFRNADNVTVVRNNAVEVFANYYFRPDRKGVYAGFLGGPEWFIMEDKLTRQREMIRKTYVVPRLGIRVFPFNKCFFTDASFGWSLNLSGTPTRTLGQSAYNASGGGFIYFLQIGARLNLVQPKF